MWITCPECRDITAFEQPPCLDGHGADCPEWCCVTCGYALIEGEVQLIELVRAGDEMAPRRVHVA
jgi:hypothetical protein